MSKITIPKTIKYKLSVANNSIMEKCYCVNCRNIENIWLIARDQFKSMKENCIISMSQDIMEIIFDVSIIEKVAIIPVKGMLSRYFDIFMYFFGGTSTEILGIITEYITENREKLGVDTIIYDFDSPGGNANGIEETARIIKNASQSLKTVAFINSMCGSAAFWLASAANTRLLASKMAIAGSIGVIITHVDFSKQDEQLGIKVTEITTGDLKNAASENAALDEKGLQYLQEKAKTVYNIMVTSIADNLQIEKQKLIKDTGSGDYYFSEEALKLGLANDFFLGSIKELALKYNEDEKEKDKMADDVKTPQTPKTTEELRLNYPELSKNMEMEAVNKALEKERERVLAVEAVILPQFAAEKEVLELKKTCSPGDMALKMVELTKKHPQKITGSTKLSIQDFHAENKPVANIGEEGSMDEVAQMKAQRKALLAKCPKSLEESTMQASGPVVSV